MAFPQTQPYQSNWQRWAVYSAFASAVSILFSIAVSQSLLGIALGLLFLSGIKLRLPPIWLPLGLFLLGTLLSLAFSLDPRAGLPQVRKIFVYTMLLVVFSTVRELVTARWLFLCWAAAGAIDGARGLVQFFSKYQEAHARGVNFYEFYISARIMGFMGHWMTFSGEEMFALLMLLAFLLFAPDVRKRGFLLWLACGAVMGLALIVSDTRSIWFATLAGGMYLLWFWKRWLVLIVPVALTVGMWFAPASIHDRFVSIFQPKKETDSNEHRRVTWLTGWEMIKAHPLLGLGPEEPKAKFMDYVPASIPRPLPTGSYIHLHNIYIHYAAERGIPTMLMLVWLLLQTLYDFFRTVRQLPPGRSNERFLLHGGVACIIGTMISGMFEHNLGDSEVLTMFLVIVACGYLAVERARQRV